MISRYSTSVLSAEEQGWVSYFALKTEAARHSESVKNFYQATIHSHQTRQPQVTYPQPTRPTQCNRCTEKLRGYLISHINQNLPFTETTVSLPCSQKRDASKYRPLTPRCRGGAVGSGTALQAGRSRVRFPIVSLEFFIDIILPAALWSLD